MERKSKKKGENVQTKRRIAICYIIATWTKSVKRENNVQMNSNLINGHVNKLNSNSHILDASFS